MERLLRGLSCAIRSFAVTMPLTIWCSKGTLGADKQRLLAQVREAIEKPQQAHLRQEWQRSLSGRAGVKPASRAPSAGFRRRLQEKYDA